MKMLLVVLVCALLLCQLQCWGSTATAVEEPPPLPVLPIPSASQLKWQRREIIMFFHFGMNTFTNSEWGTGLESPVLFDPRGLNASQWVEVATSIGVTLVILIAKHHDGFCMWPSKYTQHSVQSSPWRDGRGDMVQDIREATRSQGIDLGLYLSPWDRHEKTYGLEMEYNEYYLAQLHELLTRYGSISEIWFDGAKGANATNMTYYFDDWFQTVKQLQHSINIFSDAGPDVRWVGDEQGFAGSTCWSTINQTMLKIGDASIEAYLNTGDPKGTSWVPPECDVSIRPGWFWHPNETAKSLQELLNIYYKSVGRNCVLLLNVPPNTTGLISEDDIARLQDFHSSLRTIFATDIAGNSIAEASSQRGSKHGPFKASNVLDGKDNTYWAAEDADMAVNGCWIELKKLDPMVAFNVIRIQEPIQMGQRIGCHEIFLDGMPIINGTTVGHKRLYRLQKPMYGETLRITIHESRGPPLLSAVGLHFDPFQEDEVNPEESKNP